MFKFVNINIDKSDFSIWIDPLLSEKEYLNIVNKNGNLIKYIKNPTENIQLAAVINKVLAIQYIDNPTEATQLYSINQSAFASRFINKPTENAKILDSTKWNGFGQIGKENEDYIMSELIIPDLPIISKKKSIKQRLKDNAIKGTYRAAGRKITKITKATILRLLEANLKNREPQDKITASLKALESLFETEFGNSLIAMVLSMGLINVPKLLKNHNFNEHIYGIADDLQQESISIVEEQAFDIVMNYLIPSLTPILQGKAPIKKVKKLE
jgi:hypothetical protein